MIANWPLIGRREELALIERTLSDGQFRGLLLAGAPGVGKARLARSVVATLLTGEPAAGPVTALWKDGVAERLEIQALARAEVGELIEAVLGAPVDGLTRARLWQLGHGNADLDVAGPDVRVAPRQMSC